jgi:hypothetical protein
MVELTEIKKQTAERRVGIWDFSRQLIFLLRFWRPDERNFLPLIIKRCFAHGEV